MVELVCRVRWDLLASKDPVEPRVTRATVVSVVPRVCEERKAFLARVVPVVTRATKV